MHCDIHGTLDYCPDCIDESTESRTKYKIVDLINEHIKSYRGTSTHGNCCTCVDCKNYHDDCNCAQINALQKLKEEIENNE